MEEKKARRKAAFPLARRKKGLALLLILLFGMSLTLPLFVEVHAEGENGKGITVDKYTDSRLLPTPLQYKQNNYQENPPFSPWPGFSIPSIEDFKKWADFVKNEVGKLIDWTKVNILGGKLFDNMDPLGKLFAGLGLVVVGVGLVALAVGLAPIEGAVVTAILIGAAIGGVGALAAGLLSGDLKPMDLLLGTLGGGLLGGVGGWLAGVMGRAGGLLPFLRKAGSFFGSLGARAGSFLSGLGARAGSFLGGLGARAGSFLSGLGSRLGGFLQGLAGRAVSFMQRAWGTAMSAARFFMSHLASLAGRIGLSLLRGTLRAAEIVIQYLSRGANPFMQLLLRGAAAIRSGWSAIGGLAGLARAVWNGMKTLVRQYGGLFLIGAGINGGISLLQGSHGKTLLWDALVGGVAGMIGASVGNGVAKGAMALLGKVAGKLPVKAGGQNTGYLSRMLGVGTGSASESVAEDVLHRRKIDWKKAATSFAMAIGMLGMMGLVHGGLLSGIQKGPWDSSISAKAEQQAAVEAVRKADEVASGVAVEGAKGTGKLSTRDTLLNAVSNQKLKNAIDQMYRPGATIGDGGLADAIRHELSTGQLVGGKSHIQKGIERVRNLENIIKKENLNPNDLATAQKLLDDLKDALQIK